MWNVVSCALGVSCTFMNVKNYLLVWLKQFKGDKKKIIIVGVSAPVELMESKKHGLF
jgi:hypothetical protein